ncbi:uncharacterized protein [Rutidosis leptorrhynchoides]|uniref:uncharacterized protein n=1 Tax=Rutidosis leptorrhynchoides TaxID=125765 RepID=UPI003A99ED46
MKEVFATTVENDNGFHIIIANERSGATYTSSPIPRHGNITAHKLSNLKTMHIIKCDSLEYIFTNSTLESLNKLKEIRIRDCKAMKVIVREEDEEEKRDQTPIAPDKVVVFPRVEVIELISLSNLEGFFIGIKEFQWPLLNDVYIERCPKMTAFTCSKSIAPRLNYIEHPIFGKSSPEWYNFYKAAPSPHQTPSPSFGSTSSCPAIPLQDIKEINVENSRSEVIVAFNQLLQLQNLEKIQVKRCEQAEKILEVEYEVTDSEFNNESQTTVVKLPKLREVVLEDLSSLEYLWKNNQWRHLMQLQELQVTHCRLLWQIVKEDDDSERKVLPCLKSLKLERLERLSGFCLWKKEFLLPSLSTLVIKQSPDLSVFTNGFVDAPQLKVIETDEGFIDIARQDINSFIITQQEEDKSDLGHSTKGESTDDESADDE